MTKPDIRKGMPPVNCPARNLNGAIEAASPTRPSNRYNANWRRSSRRHGTPIAIRGSRRRRDGLVPALPIPATRSQWTGWQPARPCCRHNGGMTMPMKCRAFSSSTARRAASIPVPARCREDLAPGQACRADFRRYGICGRYPRSLEASFRIRQTNSSLQVLCLDLDGALSLAVQLLSKLFARADRRLDE